MECVACTRSDPARHYYCTSCIKSRLLEHQARKQQLRNALTLQSNRANNLLLNGPTSTSPTRSRQLGVREEGELKAERWTLSVKLRDTRIATEQEKSKVETLASEVTRRRAALNARKTNLSTARSLLTSLSTPSHPTSPSLPLSISSLNSQISQLDQSLSTLSSSLAKVRRILTLELLTTYSFKSIESPLPDPFIIHPSSSSSSSSTSSPSPSTPFPPSYSLATLPLPSLSLLPTLPTQTLEALLVNLSHLIRLLALYEGVSLPFVPLPNCFGPGKGGIRSSPGCSGWDGIVSGKEKPSREEDIAEDESTEIVGFPLGFAVEKAKSARNGVDPEDGDVTELSSKGGSSRRREASTPSSQRSDHTVSSKKLKLVMKGAIALAYDLGYICWVRESRGSDVTDGDRQNWRFEDFEDLGKLILRAAGAESEKEKNEREKRKETSLPEDIDPFPSSIDSALSTASIATLQPSPASESTPSIAFPLSFSTVSQYYLSLAFTSASSSSSKIGGKKRRKNGTIGRGTRLGESSFVDARFSTAKLGDDAEDGEEDEEEEEWDFI
ncbi:hypothetical protein JCM3765_007442 [Sporobolomyces pararoseus]